MVPYDVQAHPFNRAPNAIPSMVVETPRGTTHGSDTEDTANGSSRDSLWSVELDTGNCGCLSGYNSSPPTLPLFPQAPALFVPPGPWRPLYRS